MAIPFIGDCFVVLLLAMTFHLKHTVHDGNISNAMKNSIIVLTTAIALLLPVAGFAQSTSTTDYEQGKTCYQKLLKQGKKAPDQNWRKCISFFEEVYENDPKGNRASSALFSTARLKQERYSLTRSHGELEGAIKDFNQLIRQFPNSSLADDALYRIGCMRQDALGQEDRAYKAFTYILEKYPDGDMAVHAEARLKTLGDVKDVDNVTTSAESEKMPASSKEPSIAQNDMPVIEERNIPAIEDDASADDDNDSRQFAERADAFNRATLKGVSIDTSPTGTTVRLNLDRDVEYSVDYTEMGPRTRSPPKLDVVLLHTKPAGSLTRNVELGSPYVQSYKIKNLFLSSGIKVSFTLAPGARYDVKKSNEGLVVSFGDTAETKTVTAPSIQSSEQKPTSRLSSFRIVIDPGHGGEDEGAVGTRGTLEKDITLAIAKRLAKELRRDLGANVWLTRNDDRTLTLEQRNSFAVRKKADLFISIHANASKNRSASGIETYYLNNATDEAAARLAARENQSTRKKLSEVEHIISTMLQTYDAAESLDLATEVQARLTKQLKSSHEKVKNRGVRSALFYVLVGAKCPAILVEAAFISNPREEKLLRNKKYQKNVASAISDGVKRYFKVREKELVSL